MADKLNCSEEDILKRIVPVVASVMLLVFCFGGVAFAATVIGTSEGEVLVGTRFDDEIRGKQGRDQVMGLSGNDRLYGGRGRDRLIGGSGNDVLFSQDLNRRGIGKRDVLVCGPGYDRVVTDFEDVIGNDCEEGAQGGS